MGFGRNIAGIALEVICVSNVVQLGSSSGESWFSLVGRRGRLDFLTLFMAVICILI